MIASKIAMTVRDVTLVFACLANGFGAYWL